MSDFSSGWQAAGQGHQKNDNWSYDAKRGFDAKKESYRPHIPTGFLDAYKPPKPSAAVVSTSWSVPSYGTGDGDSIIGSFIVFGLGLAMLYAALYWDVTFWIRGCLGFLGACAVLTNLLDVLRGLLGIAMIIACVAFAGWMLSVFPATKQATASAHLPEVLESSDGVRPVYAKVLSINLNLRSCGAADASCPSLAVMPQGTQVRVLEASRDGWVKVQYVEASGETKVGFASSSRLEF